MMRALYSGVSGLKVHQTKMDVIGNNIANVNTVGFKSSTVTFSDIFYQTTQNATGPNEATGAAGMNAKQIGLGSNLAAITASITKTGGAQRTDNPFDVMITGDSFFIVNSGGTNYFTKSGAFDVDANGTLCTSTGATVMGWQVDPENPNKTIANAVSPLRIMSPENLYSEPQATTKAYISGNIDQKDPQVLNDKKGKPVQVSFFDNMGNEYNVKLAIKQTEDSTKNYTVAVTDVVNSKGESIFVTKTVDKDTGEVTYGPSAITTFDFGTATGITAEVNEETGEVTIDMADAPILAFNGETGKFVGIGEGDADVPPKSIGFTVSPGAEDSPFETVDIDFSSITMFSTSEKSSLESAKGGLDGTGAGRQVGNMTGCGIDASGKIYGKYDNGDSILLGQIAVASFANPAGLEAVGDSMFAETQNSGGFDGIGQDPTQGGGKLSTGVLEMSNVDLSAQFTDMITTQRGFQANSRIITTSDTLLEELINLKR